MKVVTFFFSTILLCTLLCLIFPQTTAAQGTVCSAPNNGGTALLPADCPYLAPSGVMYIIDGLPAGDTIKIIPRHDSFSSITRTPGGTLGGESEEFDGSLHLLMVGTRTLASFSRDITLTSDNVVHTAPRNPGNPVQSFDTDMLQMLGQLPPGDPDFDLLRIVAGTGFGMPSPGHTTLTRLSDGNWNVDSFFDIEYRIDFVGAPGGPLAGRSGSTTATIRMQQGMSSTLCLETDNGAGSVDLPADCPYVAPFDVMRIIDGLPPPTTIDITPILSSFLDVTRSPGGTLGGEIDSFQATLLCDMTGTGSLAGFTRTIPLSLNVQTHVGPRTPGQPVQSFDTDMFRLQGQLPPGDPDFDLLRITGGTNFGLPSPGHTTLTQQPGGNWNVDSFFDITYRIDFVGAPGGPLAGRSGSTTGTIRMQQGTSVPPPLGPELLFATDNFPPKAPYLSPPDSEIVFAGTTIRMKDLDHSRFSTQGPPPPLSSFQDYTYDGAMRLVRSTDNGTSFEPVVVTTSATVRMTHTLDDGVVRYYDTEMLSLQLSGGGLMLRESPTRASTGRTTIRQVTGGYQISSFFDVFTELSLDGGNSWTPSSSSIRMEMKLPVMESPQLTFAADQFPPLRSHMMQSLFSEPVAFSNGSTIKRLHIESMTPQSSPPNLGESSTLVVTGDVTLDLSPTGSDFTAHKATATARVSLAQDCNDESQDRRFFDTEMLQLDISGGTLPPGTMLRESPTRASTGRTTIRTDAGGGGYHIDSFFDVFFEISVDGGTIWSPRSNTVRVQLDVPPRESPEITVATDLQPSRGVLMSLPDVETQFENGLRIRSLGLSRFSPQTSPPELGQEEVLTVTGNGALEVSLSGPDFEAKTVTVTASGYKLQSGFIYSSQQRHYFETEMLQLDLVSTVTVTGTLRLRESPTRQSLGRTTITTDPGGTYHIDSFFDVFFEVSVDGGSNWSPATAPTRIQFDAPPREAPELTVATERIIAHHGRLLDGSDAPVNGALGVSFSRLDISNNVLMGPPPPLGEVAVGDLDGDGMMDLVVAGGDARPTAVTYTATIRAEHGYDIEGTRYFDTEMLSLSLSPVGATTTADIRLRESPTKASLGRTSIRTSTGGGGAPNYQVSSFFDVFFDMSVDGGNTWSECDRPVHLEMGVPPSATPELTFGTDHFPPRGRQRMEEGATLVFEDGSVITDLEITRLLPQQAPPALGEGRDDDCDGLADFKLSVGGNLIVVSGATLTASLSVGHYFDLDETAIFETEMLQLDLRGPEAATLTADIRLRESPSRPSLGRTTARNIGSSGQDGVAISSFFDVWTELSLDGGATWATATASIRLAIDDRPLVSPPIDVATDSLPPRGQLSSTADNVVTYPNGIELRSVVVRVTPRDGPGNLDAVTVVDLDSDGRLDLRVGSGNFEPVSATMTAVMSYDHASDGGPTRFFETEMLQLSLTSVTATADIRLRESPSRPSMGRTSITTNPGGGYSVSSFFDVFTELSIDGGTTWIPGDVPLRLEYTSSTVQLGSICLTKYFDVKHDRNYDGGDPPMSGVVFHLSGKGTYYTGTTNEDGEVCFDNIIAGDYLLTEELPNGYSYSAPESGELALTIAAGSNTPIIWLNGAGDDTLDYRTASMEDWATAVDGKGKLKAIKCKPNKVEFKFQIQAPKAATGVSVKIGQNSSGVITDANKTVTLYSWTDSKEVTYTANIDSLQVLQFEGWGTKGKAIKASFKWMTSPKITKGKVTTYITNNPRLPMPNFHNVGEDLDAQQAFPLVIGASSGAHSVSHAKYKDVLKSLTKKGTMHTGDPRCLDAFTDGKTMEKQLKSLPPDKQDNKLFAEVLTLGLNLRASERQKFPLGLGYIIWNGGGYAENWTIDSIYTFANLWLACDTNAAKIDTQGIQLYNMLVAIDTAFDGDLDTLVWSCGKLQLKGVRTLADVPYLRANPDVVVSRTGPKPIPNAVRVPVEYVLHQNYPNPFNPTTTIQFELPDVSEVTLKIYNMLGQEISTLLDRELMDDGVQEVDFDANGLPSGVYFYRLTTKPYNDDEEALSGTTLTRVMKMLLIK
jgi:hypothetical protein